MCTHHHHHQLPLDVLDGPLSSSSTSSSLSLAAAAASPDALQVAAHFLAARTDPQGRPRFSPQAFVVFVNCFLGQPAGGSSSTSSNGNSKCHDPFAAARAVWAALAAATAGEACDFRPFTPSGDAAAGGANEAPMSPTRAGQRCFLRLSDAEPGRLVLDWYYSQADEDAAFGLASGNPSWGGVALAGGARPKGVLLRWAAAAGEGEGHGAAPTPLVWEADNARLQALLAEQAASMGLDPRSLSGLVAAAQQASGAGAHHPFMEALAGEGKRQEHRRVIGAAAAVC